MLFPLEQTLPPGSRYVPEIVSLEEEASLLANIDASPWLSDLKRRVQHYGYRYDYRSKGVDASNRLGDLPEWVSFLAERCCKAGLIETVPDQLIINEYLPGQGILHHVDSVRNFGPTVISVSLGSGCMMDFTQPGSEEMLSVYLEQRSAVVLQGESRYDWMHAIAKRKSDVVNGSAIARERRVSLTFRTVILG
jgi:alkylated DNA repair dioxygenase AlkB